MFIDDIHLFVNRDGFERDRDTNWVPGIGETMTKVAPGPIELPQRIVNRGRHNDGRNGEMGGRQTVGESHLVRLRLDRLLAEPIARPSEAADDFIVEEKDVVSGQDLLNTLEGKAMSRASTEFGNTNLVIGTPSVLRDKFYF